MKRLCKLMSLIMLFLTILTGCKATLKLPESNDPPSGTAKAKVSANTTVSEEEAVSPDQAEEETVYAAKVTISRNEEFFEKTSDEGKQLVYGVFDSLGVSADGFEGLNEALQSVNEDRRKAIESDAEEYYEMALADSESGDFPEEWFPYSTEYHADVVRSDEKIVSILQTFYSFAGGAHPNTYYSAVNFDPATGKKLEIRDIVSDTEVFAKCLEEETLKTVDKDMLLFEDISEIINEKLDETISDNELTFLLDYDGLEVIFSPYDITAYAAGAQRVRLNYSDYPELIDQSYAVIPENYIEKIQEDGTGYTGRPGQKDRKAVTFEELSDEYGTISSCAVLLDGKAGQPDTEDYYYNSRKYIAHVGDKSFCLVEKQSDNDYTFMTIYDLNSDTAVKKGTVDGHIDSMTMPADPAALRIVKRCNLLSTYSVVQLHRLNEDGSVTPIEDFGYMENEDMPSHRLKKTISVNMLDDEEGKSMHEVTLGSQTELKVYRTDLDKIVDMKLKDGNVVRLVVEYGEDEFYGQMVDNTPIEEVFEEVWFAG